VAKNGILGTRRVTGVPGRTQRRDPRTGMFTTRDTSTGRFLDDKRGAGRFSFSRVRRAN
jgi:hypothetical protein